MSTRYLTCAPTLLGSPAAHLASRQVLRKGHMPDESSTSGPSKAVPDEPKRQQFPVVAIGASAGGLEAICDLLRDLDKATGMAFVLVQHLSPERHSFLAEILGRVTPIPVVDVQDGTLVEPDRIYVMPENVSMLIQAGRLVLKPRLTPAERGPSTIDDFFFSLAQERKATAVGIILSGAGTDGAKGMAAIIDEGGVTFAQDRASAKFDSMPLAAAATGVDYVLPPGEIAKELNHLARTGTVEGRRGRSLPRIEVTSGASWISSRPREGPTSRATRLLPSSGGSAARWRPPRSIRWPNMRTS